MKLPMLLCAWLVNTALLAGNEPQTKLRLLWKVETHTLLESAPTLADIDGDGLDEILVAAREELIAFDGGGHRLWGHRTTRRYCTYPAVWSVRGRRPLIYVADTGGNLTCLDGRGRVRWERKLRAGAEWAAPVVAPLLPSRTPVVIQADASGTVSAFVAETGAPLWAADVGAAAVSPAVGDVDEDGTAEIAVTTTAGRLVLLDAYGKQRWERTAGARSQTWSASAPVMFEASSGERRIVVGANEGAVTCYDAQGTLLWRRATRGSVASSISACDMDGDGMTDVFAIAQTGHVYRWDEDGRPLWDLDMQGRTIAAPALLDMNADGRMECMICTQSGRLLLLDSDGKYLTGRSFPNRTINMTPTFGDVSRRWSGYEMVITGGESGRIYCFGTGVSLTDPRRRPWVAYRQNAAKTGAWFGIRGLHWTGMRIVPESWASFGAGMPLRFEIRAPAWARLPLVARAVCNKPDGSQQSALAPILGHTGAIELPLEVNASGTYRFAWTCRDAGGRMVASGRRETVLRPLERERGMAREAAVRLRHAAGVIGSRHAPTAAALQSEAAAVETDAEGLMHDADPSTVQERAASLLRRCLRGIRVARAVLRACAAGADPSLLVFEGALWRSDDVTSAVPDRYAASPTTKRCVVAGEHDPVSVRLLNTTDHDLRVRLSYATSRGGPQVALYRSTAVPVLHGPPAWDALVPIRDGEDVVIRPLQVCETWLDVSFAASSSGAAEVILRCQPESDVAPVEARVTYGVLPFSVAPSGAFRLCAWANLGAAEITDLLAHGNNVFIVPMPRPIYSPDGTLQRFDYGTSDEILCHLRGYDVVVLVSGMPALKALIGSATYQAQLGALLRDLKQHLREYGVDASHYALYPYDEPGGAGWPTVQALVRFGRIVKQVDPRTRIYVDGGADPAMARAMAPVVDIWCPGIHQLCDDSPEMAIIRGTRKALWSYDCAYAYSTCMRASLKNTHIVAEYRTAALFAMRYGATGIGFWSYNIGPDPWQAQDMDYPLVYPGPNGPITSRRWEAVREGIEDVRILLALRRRAPSAPPPLRKRIEALIGKRLPQLLDRAHREMTMGLGAVSFYHSLNEGTLAAFRREMLDCVERLCRTPSTGNGRAQH